VDGGWRHRLEALRTRDVLAALRGAPPARLEEVAAVVGREHAAAPSRLGRVVVLAAPGLGDGDALRLAVVLTLPVHDALVEAARSGALRADPDRVVTELAGRWTPALLDLELALVRAETAPAG
jgi:hypothetical protein